MINYYVTDKCENNRKTKGFTLIELLLTIGLLIISVGLTSDILVSLIRSSSKTQVLSEIEQQANFVYAKIEKELRSAKSVSSPANGESGSVLTFINKDGKVVKYEIIEYSDNKFVGLVLRTVTGGGSRVEITSNYTRGGVKVTCSRLGCFTMSGYSPQVVGINLVFQQAQSSANISFSEKIEINTSIVIRNTY